MKDAYDMEDKEVLDRLACAHINFCNNDEFLQYNKAIQTQDMTYLRHLLNNLNSSVPM
ncbi:hypothetical protein NGB78_01355 [Staphylococcus arlettae]|jgi:hypothetical protein|uniref:Uncharacterized protein n=3 Tax=Staphylococcus arlettae TaxID=29378 RepID=A0A380CI25_9STAP|nr:MULTISPECIES: hypothetical protein [Staphylococcus]EJY94748.1 hypothetical protein SARL_12026 [Staphylococcus arlettae CVD059]ERF49958.1 hypothetical protein N039_00735 [Staphylococcus sp. EGD-HP3]MBF0738578.1 hypothetical protein [Staphylococcus arlettae]MBK3719751.1 hypothetical protein [Staphylococcus arlettae]MCD8814991.1 hypothetical protein [Staphylococcus arlettae]